MKNILILIMLFASLIVFSGCSESIPGLNPEDESDDKEDSDKDSDGNEEDSDENEEDSTENEDELNEK